MRRALVWTALLALLAFVASLPWWMELPPPRGAHAITTAFCVSGCDKSAQVALPVARTSRADQAVYRLSFHLDAPPARPLYLFIPLLNQRARVSLAGQQIADTAMRAPMIGLTTGATALLPLPHGALSVGANTLDVTLTTQGVARGYLSAVYVGTAQQLAPAYRLRLFLFEHLRLMTLAAQLVVGIAVLVAWLYRPRNALFGWTLMLLTVSMFSYVGLVSELSPYGSRLLAYSAIVTSATGFILCVVALLVSGLGVPRWLKTAVFAVPGTLLLVAATGQWFEAYPNGLAVLSLGPLMLLTTLPAAAITAWGALVRGRTEACLLLVPMLAMAAAMVHDTAVATMWIDGPVFLGIYYRQALTLGVAVILARRLGISLTRLDEANAHLTRRLAEREAELSHLYAEERREAAQHVRHEERQRLTADLHDGLSGHLASIIALAERARSADIERSAREALDDLRAVIHSLDIGDRELNVALSGFRERLERQMKRTGIALRWSMAGLPEIAGVTPTHALNVLRILQEAITNAVRHGPATRISIVGGAALAGEATISVENDGAPFALDRGWGLDNMRRRALQLDGVVRIASLPSGTRVTLVLPAVLPAAAEAPATAS